MVKTSKNVYLQTKRQLLLFLESTGVIVGRLDVDRAACLLAARC